MRVGFQVIPVSGGKRVVFRLLSDVTVIRKLRRFASYSVAISAVKG